MKVLVKCFENNLLMNAWMPYVHAFDRVIYLSESEVAIDKVETIKQLVETRNQTEFKLVQLYQTSIDRIDEIIRTYQDHSLVIQVDGSGYLAKLLHEYAIEKHLARVTIDLDKEKIKSLEKGEGFESHTYPLMLDLKQIVALRQSKIVATHRRIISLHEEDFQKDVFRVFNIIKRAHRQWAHWMQDFTRELSLQRYRKKGLELPSSLYESPIFKKLREANILIVKHQQVYFKNDRIESLFQDIGVWLEYYVYIQLEKSNEFSDVLIGAIIDYDGMQGQTFEPTCEIDVMCVRKLRNAFISCKMNKVDANTLNEIKLHTLTFGNEWTKAIVVTCANLNRENPVIYRKAQELGIYIIEQDAILSGQIVGSILKILDQ